MGKDIRLDPRPRISAIDDHRFPWHAIWGNLVLFDFKVVLHSAQLDLVGTTVVRRTNLADDAFRKLFLIVRADIVRNFRRVGRLEPA